MPLAAQDKEPLHVDEFIWNHFGDDKYARFFFMLHRLPAAVQMDWQEWISQYKLFCTYKGERFRVTGASRLGDVWLARDFNKDTGYDLRVDVQECSEWTNGEVK